MKILVVDDEKDVQLLFQQRFRKEIRNGEFNFIFAFSGEEALTTLNNMEHEAILILSDINMPGMSGLELLEQIKKNYVKPPPVVMMITAYGDEENYKTSIQLGADDFLTKPLDFTTLKKQIEKLDMTAKILVVDDETDLEILIKQKFRKKIREKEYEFFFAINGKDALEKLVEQPDVDIVLSDINMPEMDGLTLLTKLNELNPLIKSVIVSAYGDMENIRTAMNRGAFDFITKPIDFDDLTLTMEKTLKHANQIKKTLQAIKENNILKMYVDENVLNFMDSREYESTIMANETIEGTVVFIDVCGFTKISENAPADTVVKMINSYFDIMVKEIMAQEGLIDKFIGDAIMAVFRGEYHLDRAIDAALAVRNKINSLSVIGDKQFKPKVSIGIKCGEMISGNIGSSSLKRLDYTVIGDTVNTAARLQDAAKENQILISESCYKKVKESFRLNELGSITLKNKSQPLKIYEVLE